MGTAGWVQGNIVQVSAVREIKKEDDGKGGPVTVTYEARQDFCIMAAESCELRDSTIVGVLMVRQNGNIVYDMRVESNFGAENAKFLQNHVFYYGAEDQMPNPTMEAISGVGNTPAYRGVFTMIGFDVDLTPFGNAIPTYEFVLVGEGEGASETITQTVVPRLSRFSNGEFPLVDDLASYTYVGRIGTQQPGGGVVTYTGTSLQDVIDYFTNYDYSGVGGGSRAPVHYLGFSAQTTYNNIPSIGLNISDFGVSNARSQPDVTDNYSLVLVYNDEVPSDTHPNLAGWSPYCSIGAGIVEQDGRGTVGVRFGSDPGGQWSLGAVCPGNDIYVKYPLCIAVYRKPILPEAEYGDPCELGIPTLIPDAPGYVVDCDGTITPEPTYAFEAATYRQLHEGTTSYHVDLGRTIYDIYPVGPILRNDHPDYNNSAFWIGAYNSAVAEGLLPAGWSYLSQYPDLVSTAVVAEYETSWLTNSPLSVATAIQRICKRSSLLPTDIDTSEIDDTLEGYPIQADYNGADCIRPLLAYVAGFGAEYDGKIHFHAYGGPVEITIDPADFIEGSENTDDDTREQPVEFPRKVSVSYIDITQNYTVRPQYAYRNSPDVRAVGEETVQLPLCATPDRASKLADISMKVSWARAQGTRKFSVPWIGYNDYLKLVAGFPMGLEGQRRVGNRVTIEDGTLAIEAAYDRQSAYTSIATGVPAQPPTPPRSTIGGVTLFAALNIPALRDQDDRIGMYFAVCGLLDSWSGASLQMSSDDGVTWDTVISSMTQASVMGYLTDGIADAAEAGDDTTNVVRVKVHGGELNSITRLQYLSEGNPSALVHSDATAELIQFQDAEELADDNYELTMLARGRLGSETMEHPAGTKFVFLDSVYFLELPSSLIGRTLQFRAVTFGTSPDTSTVYSVPFYPVYTQTELAPIFVSASVDMDILSIELMARHRFGVDMNPIPSGNYKGFAGTITDGTNTKSLTDVNGQLAPANIAGWSSPITLTAYQVNRITGNGIPLTHEIEI